MALEAESAPRPGPPAGAVARLLPLVLALAGGGWFVYSRLDSFWSGSADLAQHILIVSRLMDGSGLSAADPSVGAVLAGTPFYAHILGAIAGKATGSAVQGVQVVALLALVGLWLAVTLAALNLPPRIASVFLPVLYVFYLVNDRSLRLELFGHEIAGNFFFAHLVAQALSIGLVAIYAASERAGRFPCLRYWLLALAAPLLAGTHLLPAVEIVGFLALNVLLDVLTAPAGGRVRTTFAGGAAVVAAVALVALHPAFADSAAISAHDGVLTLRYTPSAVSVSVLAVLTGAACLAGAYRWAAMPGESRREWTYLRAVSLLGLSTALCCLAQYGALLAGYGSPYAVKKYAFGLNTVLVLLAVLAVAAALARRARAAPVARRTVLLLACLCPLMLVLSPNYRGARPIIAVSRLAEVERAARAWRAEVPPDSARDDYAMGIAGIRGAGNFLVSLDALHARNDDNAVAVLRERIPPRPEAIRYILTTPGAQPWDVPECRRSADAAGLVVIDGACVFDRMPR